MSLSQVLAAIAKGVQQQMGELLAAVMAPASGLHAFDFLGGSIMPEVDEAVSKALPGEKIGCEAILTLTLMFSPWSVQ